MGLLITILILASTASSKPTHRSTCAPTTSERTHWGNITVQIDLQEKPFRSLWGTVHEYSDFADGALVEVYARPLNDPSTPSADHKAGIENRVSACVTGNTGDFAFDLSSGQYRDSQQQSRLENYLHVGRGRHKEGQENRTPNFVASRNIAAHHSYPSPFTSPPPSASPSPSPPIALP